MTNENQTNETKTGFCDICGAQETGATQNLKSEGWHLGCREEFYPNCND